MRKKDYEKEKIGGYPVYAAGSGFDGRVRTRTGYGRQGGGSLLGVRGEDRGGAAGP